MQLTRLVISNVTEELFQDQVRTVSLDYDMRDIVVVFNIAWSDDLDDMAPAMRLIEEQLKKSQILIAEQCKIYTSIGVSQPYRGLRNLYKCHLQAQSALANQPVSDVYGLNFYDEKQAGALAYSYSLDAEIYLMNSAKAGDYAKVTEILDTLAEENAGIFTDKAAAVSQCFMMDLMGTLLRLCEELSVPAEVLDIPVAQRLAAKSGGTDFYVKDGEVKFGAYEPEYKDFVAEMAKWYAESLLDPEFSTQDATQFESKMTSDVGAAYYGSLSGNLGKFLNARADDPEYDLVAAPMPKAPDGNIYVAVNAYGKLVPHGAAVSTTNEHIVETVKWLDWHYSEEGSTLFNWGIEGQAYEVVDGKKQFTDLIFNNPDGLSYEEAGARYAGGVITQMPIVEDPEVFLQMKSLPQQKEASALWSAADTSMILPQLYFSSEITTENANIMSEINTYVAEQFNKYVMGIESLDTFDQFQQQLKDMGIETVLANYQASYDAVYKS